MNIWYHKIDNNVISGDSGSAGMEFRNNLGLGVCALHPCFNWDKEQNTANIALANVIYVLMYMRLPLSTCRWEGVLPLLRTGQTLPSSMSRLPTHCFLAMLQLVGFIFFHQSLQQKFVTAGSDNKGIILAWGTNQGESVRCLNISPD